jgi:hypothetical protein
VSEARETRFSARRVATVVAVLGAGLFTAGLVLVALDLALRESPVVDP